MVAVQLDGRWYRQDPRGDKPGVSTEFSLTDERLALARPRRTDLSRGTPVRGGGPGPERTSP